MADFACMASSIVARANLLWIFFAFSGQMGRKNEQ